MIGEQIFPALWLTLPMDVRQELAKEFDLKKTGEVLTTIGASGNHVQSDGYSAKDLMAITTEKMTEYVGAHPEDGFFMMFNRCLKKAERLINERNSKVTASEEPKDAKKAK